MQGAGYADLFFVLKVLWNKADEMPCKQLRKNSYCKSLSMATALASQE